MTEFIVRLTDEQEQFLRNWNEAAELPTDIDSFKQLFAINRSIRTQITAAIKLYDELVAAAQEASDV